jgi:hypothetical protein
MTAKCGDTTPHRGHALIRLGTWCAGNQAIVVEVRACPTHAVPLDAFGSCPVCRQLRAVARKKGAHL